MLSLTAVMPPHEIDHDADGDEDHGAGRPAENAESANIGDHKHATPNVANVAAVVAKARRDP